MKEIKLTRGQVAIVDDDNFEWLNSFKWYAVRASGKYFYGYYAVRTITEENGKRRAVYMHKVILGIDGTNIIGDHKNGDRLNNTRENLRTATPKENNWNHKIRDNNTSGFNGVSWYKPYNNFRVQIRINGKTTHIGYFKTAIEAAKAYDLKAIELHGEYARLNILKTVRMQEGK